MKVAVQIVYPDRQVRMGWLSSGPVSSYGPPVLIDLHDNALAPADLPPGTVVRVPTKHLLFAEGARVAGYTVEN